MGCASFTAKRGKVTYQQTVSANFGGSPWYTSGGGAGLLNPGERSSAALKAGCAQLSRMPS